MAFGPGDRVRLWATVLNPTGQAVTAELSWMVVGDENGHFIANLSDTRTISVPAGSSEQVLDGVVAANTPWGPYVLLFSASAAGTDATTEARLFISANTAWFDDFSSPASGWSTEDGAGLRTAYLGGEYSMLVRTPNMGYLSRSPRNPRADYVAVEFDVHRMAVTDDMHGLVLRGSDGNAPTLNYILDDAGSFTVYRYSPGGGVVDLVSWTKAPLLLGTAPNHLLLVRRADDVLVYANNQQLARVTEPVLPAVTWPTFVVFSGDRPAEVRFDNYRQYNVAP